MGFVGYVLSVVTVAVATAIGKLIEMNKKRWSWSGVVFRRMLSRAEKLPRFMCLLLLCM